MAVSEVEMKERIAEADRKNEMHKMKISIMQDKLTELRVTMKEDKNIIENLLFRYDKKIILKDDNMDTKIDINDVDKSGMIIKMTILIDITQKENIQLENIENEYDYDKKLSTIKDSISKLLRDHKIKERQLRYLESKYRYQNRMIKEIEKYNTVLMLVRGYLRDNVKRYNTSDVFTIIAAYYMLSSLGTDLTKPFDHYANENDAKTKRKAREDKFRKRLNQEAYYAPINFFGDGSDTESSNEGNSSNTKIDNEAKILNKINQNNASMDTKTGNDNDISPLIVKAPTIESDHERSDIVHYNPNIMYHSDLDNCTLNDENKAQSLSLASRANHIYQQQVDYMVKHLKSIESMISQKKNDIDKLIWQYKPSSLYNIEPNIDSKKIDDIYQTKYNLLRPIILKNFEIRKRTQELDNKIKLYNDRKMNLANNIEKITNSTTNVQQKLKTQTNIINKFDDSKTVFFTSFKASILKNYPD